VRSSAIRPDGHSTSPGRHARSAGRSTTVHQPWWPDQPLDNHRPPV